MSEAGNRTTRQSRAPYFLVTAVCIAIIAAAILTNAFKRDSGETVPSPRPVDLQPPAIGAPPAPSASVAEQSAAMTASTQGRREMRKQKLQQARLAMASRYEQEAVDMAWSATKEANLQTLAESPTFQQAGIVPVTLQIDCRSTLCKVNASHATYGASADWAMIYMTSSAAEVTHTFTKTTNNPDGTTSVEIYAQAR